MWDGMTLIPGRDCGGCTVCCVFPTINKPEIQKLSGARCRHCASTGCGIYDSRPPVCRAYYCAWRTVDIFSDEWRPDKSGVLAYVETEGISDAFDLSTGIGLMLVDNPLKTVRQKWFQEFVVTGVMNSVPLFLSLPGPRGHQAATVSATLGSRGSLRCRAPRCAASPPLLALRAIRGRRVIAPADCCSAE